ncbi:DUF3102 domain-containing protein [Mesorhizobium cantuariense]|uniref:DUF3102 domain-containing protein n=1 Tax=Mesorhizobium cantuariense TaxID=1300275 RepID=A0ABV7MRT8_9HYPH
MTIDPRVRALCDEFDVEIIDGGAYPEPGQTRAPATIRRIIDRYGEPHARLVMCVLAEGRGNAALIDEVSLWAISDLVRACADVVDENAGGFLDIFDNLPLGAYLAVVNELLGKVRQREALVGMLYLHVRRLRADSITGRDASRHRTEKANGSEIEKGRPQFRKGAHRTVAEKVAIGRQLIEAKASMRWGTFGPWLKQSGIGQHAALNCMRAARAADGEDDQAVAT